MENIDSNSVNENIQPDNEKSQTTEVESSSSKFKNFFKKWLLYRLPTFLAWVWISFTVFSYKLPIEFRVENYLIFPYLTVVILFILTGHWLRVSWYFPYFLFFPFLIIILPFIFVWKIWKKSDSGISLLKVVANGINFIRSVKAIILLFLIVIVGWSAVTLAHSDDYKATFALIAHISAYLLFLQSFRWASNPYKPIVSTIGFLSRIGRTLIKTYVESNLKKDLKERDNSVQMCNQVLAFIDKIYQPDAPLKRGITAITHGNLSFIFTIGISFIYGLLATSFSFTLYVIEGTWGKIIQGLGDAPTKMTYFYFSFLSQATAIPDDIKPINIYGELWIVWQVMTGLLLLTGLITLFTSAMGIHSESTLKEIGEFFNQAKTDLTGWRNELNQPIIDIEAKTVDINLQTLNK